MQYQKEEVRQRIVDAATAEFESRGFFRTSMMQISSRARVPIGNLYRYFVNKEALFDAIVGTAYDSLIAAINDLYISQKNRHEVGPDATFLMARQTAEALSEISRNYRRAFLLLIQKSGGSRYENFKDEIAALTRKICETGLLQLEEENNKLLCSILAKNLTEALFTIFVDCPFEEQRDQIMKLFVFYFRNVDDRL